MTNDLKYPIGKFERPNVITPIIINEWITIISNFPESLSKAVNNLSDHQLDTCYREQGWTVRQVVHHCADSHMNAFCRFKLAMTEENPTIKPYCEKRWAELPDSKRIHVEDSLFILKGLHSRWTILLNNLDKGNLLRTFFHPDHGKQTVEEAIGLYAWHCKHHLAHITTLIKAQNWVNLA